MCAAQPIPEWLNARNKSAELDSRSFSMTGSFMLLAAVSGICALAVLVFLRKRQEKLSLARLAELPCPDCERRYGEDIMVNATFISYRWTLARGHNHASLGLPRRTCLVICPHCLAEFELKEDGTPFEHPQHGILSCVRTGRPRSGNPGMPLAVGASARLRSPMV